MLDERSKRFLKIAFLNVMQRNHEIKVRFNEEEFRKLCSLVEKSKYSREAYIRCLLDGVTPIEAPSIDFYRMMQELNAIGNNLNQISRKANSLHVVNAIEYQEFAKSLDKIILAIMKQCMLPKGKPT